MESIRTSKEILKEWVESKHKCESLEEFTDKLYEYLSDNHYRL